MRVADGARFATTARRPRAPLGRRAPPSSVKGTSRRRSSTPRGSRSLARDRSGWCCYCLHWRAGTVAVVRASSECWGAMDPRLGGRGSARLVVWRRRRRLGGCMYSSGGWLRLPTTPDCRRTTRQARGRARASAQDEASWSFALAALWNGGSSAVLKGAVEGGGPGAAALRAFGRATNVGNPRLAQDRVAAGQFAACDATRRSPPSTRHQVVQLVPVLCGCVCSVFGNGTTTRERGKGTRQHVAGIGEHATDDCELPDCSCGPE